MRIFHINGIAAILLVLHSVMGISIKNILEFSGDRKWREFKDEYNKIYPTPIEENVAYVAFRANSELVRIQNSKYKMNQTTYYCKLNDNSDIDAKTWLKATSGFIPSILGSVTSVLKSGLNLLRPQNRSKRSTEPAMPSTLDFRPITTSSVKNQGDCGSCYSFATAAAMEAQAKLFYRAEVELSNQQIVDCSSKYGNMGCEGGCYDATFNYVKNNRLTYFSTYPNTQNTGVCRVSNSTSESHVFLEDYLYIGKVNSSTLKYFLILLGPLVVTIKCTVYQLQSYSGGKFEDSSCKDTKYEDLNHTVLLVGFLEDCWIIKNSYGPDWGEGGYGYISEKTDCGITLSPVWLQVNVSPSP